jgi:hypothetical protein
LAISNEKISAFTEKKEIVQSMSRKEFVWRQYAVVKLLWDIKI